MAKSILIHTPSARCHLFFTDRVKLERKSSRGLECLLVAPEKLRFEKPGYHLGVAYEAAGFADDGVGICSHELIEVEELFSFSVYIAHHIDGPTFVYRETG